MNTELIIKENSISAFDKISNPLEAAEKMGAWFAKSKMFGVATPEQGCVLAFTCIVEKKNPIEFMRTYHLLSDGKLQMRADAMLASFDSRGGIHEWIKTGEDGEAVLSLSKNGISIESRYTIKDAEKGNLIKPNSGWTKNPANMLRARATSNGIRMIDPAVCAGAYTPEELEDEGHDQNPTPPKSQPKTEKKPESLPPPKTQAPVIETDILPLFSYRTEDIEGGKKLHIISTPESEYKSSDEGLGKKIADIMMMNASEIKVTFQKVKQGFKLLDIENVVKQ